jgi:hypothetical protein
MSCGQKTVGRKGEKVAENARYRLKSHPTSAIQVGLAGQPVSM